ncbi:hypothetical protein AB6866_06870 [Rahnella inusitata]
MASLKVGSAQMTLPGAPCFRGLTELTNFQLNAQTLAGLRCNSV